jgi:hypothetical protein
MAASGGNGQRNARAGSSLQRVGVALAHLAVGTEQGAVEIDRDHFELGIGHCLDSLIGEMVLGIRRLNTDDTD